MGDMEPRSIEDREERIKQIDARLAELDAEFADSQMTDEAREEWNILNSERDQHGSTVAELKRRRERLRQLAGNPAATERAGGDGGEQCIGVPAYVPYHGDDIYDVQRIRTASRSEEEFRSRLHDNARRAIERAAFPVPAAGKEDVQGHVEALLARVDDRSGTFARRILGTGSPVYDRAFGKAVMGGLHTLSADEQRAMSVYGNSGADGGLAVPFQLDPTVILTSDGTISPLRRIARVEQIVSKTWQGITSSGITVSRSAEGAAATGNEFSVAQPEVSPTRVIADVQFSVELDQDWSQLRGEIARLLADAKMVEEDTSFITGDGTGNNPFGVVTTLAAGSEVPTAGVSTFGLADVDNLEGALPVRFRSRASFLANRAIYQEFRTLLRAQAASAGDRWVNHTADMPASIDGYNAYEASTMESDYTAAARLMLFGDFSQFLIVDRLGMNIELNPHVTNGSGRWTGQRSIVAVWRNSSKILTDNAFRVLTGHAV
jgi:HK97 family phage major capsid protein